MKIANDMTKLVGRTPLVWPNRVTQEYQARIARKLEFFNPAFSGDKVRFL